jgi:glycerol-3-phosphate acyltransferase PlsY
VIAIGAVVVCSYLLGSWSPSILVSRIRLGIDIREHGSGNAGATNVARVIGWKPAILVLVLDAAKGFVAVWLLPRLPLGPVPWGDEPVEALAGFCVVVGHCWPVFSRFRGGKGVATAAGVLLAARPLVFAVCAIAFAVVVVASRFVSLASMSAAVAAPVALLAMRAWSGSAVSGPLLAMGTALAALVVFTHRSNIRNLIAGKEERFSAARGP